MSEFDSTLPGTSAGETNSSASARKARAAREAGHRRRHTATASASAVSSDTIQPTRQLHGA